MGSHFLKLYREILNDPKMGQLDDHLWRRVVEFSLVSKLGSSQGYLPNMALLAWRLHSTEQELAIDLAKLQEAGFVATDASGEQYLLDARLRPKAVRDERNTPDYKAWRDAVKLRDLNLCQACGEDDERAALHAHHILPWAEFPESRFDLGNGITLCAGCHHKAHREMKSQ